MEPNKSIELATVEGAGLYIRERFSLKRVVAADLQVTDAVAGSTEGDDLTAAVI